VLRSFELGPWGGIVESLQASHQKRVP